jgi:manganese/iron transport system ATP-binding protein
VGAAFAYGPTVALTGVTGELAPGTALALIGPNGGGKSTLLRGLLGLVGVAAGELSVLGSRAASARSRIGYMPQSDEIDPEFPVSLAQVVMMGRYRSIGWAKRPGRADRAAVAEALDRVGLADRAHARFGELSGGQRQRGLLARALVSDPALVLLDEPFNGLDQANRDALLAIVAELKASGTALVLSTHDLDLARDACEQSLLLNGHQVAFGRTDDVLTLANLEALYGDVQVELDEHTFVVPGHEHG